jgi:murein DD-endopeptidase MepM/ murein hydrolase activator NlpD
MNAPVDAILQAAGTALNRIYAGDTLALDYEAGQTRPFRLRFLNDDPVVRSLEWDGSHYTLRSYPLPFEVEPTVANLTVQSSLWAAGEAAGLRASQIMGLAHIFDTEVDFNSELEEGATIRLVADKLVDPSGQVRFGDIRGAMLKNGKDTYTFIRFRGSDGQEDWYEPDGDGRKRPFLRSPLEFMHVTSGFSEARYHPILHRIRAHVGVDLAAPTGTPVRAVADGTVIYAGVHGGHGNYVELDHEGPYGTSYAHLSAILVHDGEKVHQGDIIGRVGQTGLATGPHLHYQMTIDGKFVDPMSVTLPMTGGLQAPDLAAFRQVRDDVMAQLQGP